MWHGGGPRRPIGDVQTDVHIVPVDSDSPLRNLLKVQTVRCALVLYKGNIHPHPAPSLVFHILYLTDCKQLTCLQVVSDVQSDFVKCKDDFYWF